MYTNTLKAAVGLTIIGLAAPAFAQVSDEGLPPTPVREISLDSAIEEALERNPDLAVAEARFDAARSAGRIASAPLWPQLDVEGGYTRSVDPVFAFGTKLRQRRFGAEDLDIGALNDPAAIADWSAAVAFRWSLLDPTVWAGRSAARNRAKAADWAARRTREATVLMTRTFYHRAQAAAARLESASATVEAGQVTLEAFRRRHERGLLTDADLLQAEAELAAARAQLSDAERARLDALQDLSRQLGWGPDTLPEPGDPLAPPQPIGSREFDPGRRADVRALAAAEAAAGAARSRALFAFMPALQAFAQLVTHAEDFGFEEDDWTVGLMLRWTLFSGFSRSAELQRANAEQRIARIEYERALKDARRELDLAERAVRSARDQVAATQAAAEAAESGRDLMRRRFDEGLATAADLLQAEARATGMRNQAINALAQYHMAVARLEFVRSQATTESDR